MNLWYELLLATGQTVYMVTLSAFFTVFIGLPLGILLYVNKQLKPKPWLEKVLTGFINAVRSIPFIILLVLLIPVTRFLIGSSIGIHAAIVPLSLGAAPFFARLVCNNYQNLSIGLLQTGASMGANTWQMIRFILFPEAIVSTIQSITMTVITLINYSAMAGVVGGGGLGDLAIRYGYQRFNFTLMIATVIILIAMVQLVQTLGDCLVKRYVK